jgi:hypothetical protein
MGGPVEKLWPKCTFKGTALNVNLVHGWNLYTLCCNVVHFFGVDSVVFFSSQCCFLPDWVICIQFFTGEFVSCLSLFYKALIHQKYIYIYIYIYIMPYEFSFR